TLVTDNTPKKENYSSHSADIVTEESDLSDPELSATNDYDILNPKDFNKSNFRIDLEPSKIVTGEHVSIKLLGKKSLTPDIRNLYGSTPYKEFNLSISNGADIYKDKHGREIEYTFTKPGNYTLKWSYKGSTITRKITVSPSNITVFDQNEQADE
ncbi:MAG: hypothetical protein K2G64_06135, partial [Muribaculaceae bacterium]|nr:hypothetical protein [Muribaculaceae bacterium]